MTDIDSNLCCISPREPGDYSSIDPHWNEINDYLVSPKLPQSPKSLFLLPFIRTLREPQYVLQ